MSINQTDLRVIKTRRGLREAFIRLLLENEYDAISIQDIATEAEAARVTFYRHYKNKEELLLDCLNATYLDLAEHLDGDAGVNLQQEYSPVQVFYEHILEAEPLYHILFSNRGTQAAVARLRQFLAQRTKQQILARVPEEQLLAPVDIIAYHIASAQIGLAAWWLENDKPYPPDYMAQISFWLSMAGSARGVSLAEFTLDPPKMSEC